MSNMQPVSHPPTESLTLERIFHALGDRGRLTMFRRMAASPGLACGAVCEVMPRSTLSHNTRILRDAGLIQSERRGKELVNRVRADDLEARFPGLMAIVLGAPTAI